MDSFRDTVLNATDMLRDRPLLRKVHGTALVAGDIHGDLQALESVIELRDELGAEKLMLLGDYVDRGEKQVEVIHKIADTIISDKGFIPLRGNHEDIKVCTRYGFMSELKRKQQDSGPVMEFFSHLPNAAVSNEAFLCHGGIPIDTEFEITRINQFERDESLQSDYQRQLLWNDPIFQGEEDEFDKLPSRRGPGIWNFGSSITSQFFNKHDLKLLLRAHIALPSGAEWMQDKRILSLFTSKGGPYKGHERKAAFLDLDDVSTTEVISVK